MKRYAYTRPDGGVSIVSPAPGVPWEQTRSAIPPEIDESAIFVLDDTMLVGDRTFRDAWVYDGERLVVDLDRAIGIQLDRIRVSRNEALSATDVPFRKALEKWVESGDNKEALAIAKEAQWLRDIPQNIDLGKAQTAEELKEIWPEGLVRE